MRVVLLNVILQLSSEFSVALVMFWLHNNATPSICMLVINTTMKQLVIAH